MKLELNVLYNKVVNHFILNTFFYDIDNLKYS